MQLRECVDLLEVVLERAVHKTCGDDRRSRRLHRGQRLGRHLRRSDRVERSIRAGVPAARVIYLEPDVDVSAKPGAFVEAHEGHIDPDDPDYVAITGTRIEVDDDGEDIWTT